MKPALAVAGLLVCSALQAGEPAPSAEPDAYGSWMELPQEDWPKIAVVNQIDYTDGHHPVAGCGFLLEVGDEVLAATAKHVLTYFKSAEMDSVDFQGTLRSWKMFPKDRPSEVVVVGELINQDAEESLQRIACEKDWLVFTVERASKEIQPLRFRTAPLQPDEPVYVLGWRYTDVDCPQIVYEGEYVRSEKGSVQITVEKLIDNTIPGLSGAPVIDARGYLIGMMSRGSGRIQRLSPIEYPRELLKGRSDSR
ncbi:MAG: S1 family peptidase [Planctomycetota bacterium]